MNKEYEIKGEELYLSVASASPIFKAAGSIYALLGILVWLIGFG